MLAQRQPSFKECVIAHWSSDFAPKIIGAKAITEAMGLSRNIELVEERTVKRRRCTERSAGVYSSDSVGMSSENYGEKP